MKKSELLNQLNRYQELVQEFDNELDNLESVLPNIAEAPVFSAVEKLIKKAVGDWVEQFGEWVLDWRYIHKFGEEPMRIVDVYSKVTIISNNEQFADFFGSDKEK